MYDGGKIITGLVIGIGLLLFPFWWPSAGEYAEKAPEPELSAEAIKAKACIEPKWFMRRQHMKILDAWRNEAVRDADRVYESSTGKRYEKSLQNTCMACHTNKSTFCDRCHNYVGAKPICWDCHFVPGESM